MLLETEDSILLGEGVRSMFLLSLSYIRLLDVDTN
jgi:hypothetical protein